MGEGKGDSIENKNKNAQLTIQCELFGNPCTAAGPKARAVFIAAPVYGTANLLDEVSCAIPCCEAPVAGPGFGEDMLAEADLQMASKQRQAYADLHRG